MTQTKVELGLDVKALSTITTADNTDTLSLISTDADAAVGPNINMFRNSGSVAANDYLGTIAFSGKDDAGNIHDYVIFETQAETVTNGGEDGSLYISSFIDGSSVARLSFDNAIEVGVSNITLSDSNKIFTINKDVTNSYFKFEIKIKPSAACTLQVWKNGSHLSYSDYDLETDYHATVSWIESASFDDTFEFRLKTASTSSVTNTDKDTLLIEFIGS